MTARCVSRCCSGLARYWSGTGLAGPHGGAEPVLTLHGMEIVLHFSEHPVTPSPGRNTPPWPRGPRPLWEQKSQQGRARRTQIFGSGGAAACGRQPPAPEPGVVTHAGDFQGDPEGCRRRPVPASHPPPAPRLTCAPGPWGRRSGPGSPRVSAGCPSPLGASPVPYPPHSLPREVPQVRSKGPVKETVRLEARAKAGFRTRCHGPVSPQHTHRSGDVPRAWQVPRPRCAEWEPGRGWGEGNSPEAPLGARQARNRSRGPEGGGSGRPASKSGPCDLEGLGTQ